MRTIAELEALARERLEPAHYDYYAGGAGDESTLWANEAEFRRRVLVPRALRRVDNRDLTTEIAGTTLALPILVCPTAFHRLAHPDGELATAQAAAEAGTVFTVSMASTTSVEDIAKVAAPLWFQLYPQPDREFTRAVVRRAEEAGVKALVVTVDSAVYSRRERDHRNGFLDLPPGFVAENMRDATGQVRSIEMSGVLDWSELDWLRSITELPLLLKGIVHPEDARQAVEAGVAGIFVSNHGGRQLDGAIASLAALPEVVSVVDGRVPIVLDGGVRTGSDVVKALALGADAVGIGRPVLWGLAAAGQEGVAEVLARLREETDIAMALCGARTPRELTADLVR